MQVREEQGQLQPKQILSVACSEESDWEVAFLELGPSPKLGRLDALPESKRVIRNCLEPWSIVYMHPSYGIYYLQYSRWRIPLYPGTHRRQYHSGPKHDQEHQLATWNLARPKIRGERNKTTVTKVLRTPKRRDYNGDKNISASIDTYRSHFVSSQKVVDRM